LTAFVSLVQAYAVWLYLLCVLGILIAVKMLTDARRLSRTTLFSLEQERATEQSYRGIILIVFLLFIIMVVTAVGVIGPMLVPPQEPVVLGGATATLPALIFPTNTPSPTPTLTPPPPTPTVFVTSVPITPTATRAIKPAAPPATPTPPLPAPVLTAPPDGNVFTGSGQANAALTFKWTWECTQCQLGPSDKFVVVILFTNASGGPQVVAGGTRDDFLRMADIIRGGQEVWHQSKDDTYQWYVQVKRSPDDKPLSPPSETWSFVWH
jgi:hypothetical protein